MKKSLLNLNKGTLVMATFVSLWTANVLAHKRPLFKANLKREEVAEPVKSTNYCKPAFVEELAEILSKNTLEGLPLSNKQKAKIKATHTMHSIRTLSAQYRLVDVDQIEIGSRPHLKLHLTDKKKVTKTLVVNIKAAGSDAESAELVMVSNTGVKEELCQLPTNTNKRLRRVETPIVAAKPVKHFFKSKKSNLELSGFQSSAFIPDASKQADAYGVVLTAPLSNMYGTYARVSAGAAMVDYGDATKKASHPMGVISAEVSRNPFQKMKDTSVVKRTSHRRLENGQIQVTETMYNKHTGIILEQRSWLQKTKKR